MEHKWFLSYKGHKFGEKYKVIHPNGTEIGELIKKEDGYYDFWPVPYNGGYWPGYILLDISKAIEELNAGWDFHIQHNL